MTPKTPERWEERFVRFYKQIFQGNLLDDIEDFKSFIRQVEKESYVKGLADNQKKGEAWRKGYQAGLAGTKAEKVAKCVEHPKCCNNCWDQQGDGVRVCWNPACPCHSKEKRCKSGCGCKYDSNENFHEAACDFEEVEPECTCYEMENGHQPGCPMKKYPEVTEEWREAFKLFWSKYEDDHTHRPEFEAFISKFLSRERAEWKASLVTLCELKIEEPRWDETTTYGDTKHSHPAVIFGRNSVCKELIEKYK